MADIKCKDCDAIDNLTKCNDEGCGMIFCDKHIESGLKQWAGGCSRFFCKDDLEKYQDVQVYSTCKEGFDQEED